MEAAEYRGKKRKRSRPHVVNSNFQFDAASDIRPQVIAEPFLDIDHPPAGDSERKSKKPKHRHDGEKTFGAEKQGPVQDVKKDQIASSPAKDPALLFAQRKKDKEKRSVRKAEAKQKDQEEPAITGTVQTFSSLDPLAQRATGPVVKDEAYKAARKQAKKERQRAAREAYREIDRHVAEGTAPGATPSNHRIDRARNAAVPDAEPVALGHTSRRHGRQHVKSKIDGKVQLSRASAKTVRQHQKVFHSYEDGQSKGAKEDKVEEWLNPERQSEAASTRLLSSHPHKLSSHVHSLKVSKPIAPQKFECPPDQLRRSSREEMEQYIRTINDESESDVESDFESVSDVAPKTTRGSWYESWAEKIKAAGKSAPKTTNNTGDDSDAVYEVIDEISEGFLEVNGPSIDDCKPEPEQASTGHQDHLTVPCSAEDANDVADQGVNKNEKDLKTRMEDSISEQGSAGGQSYDKNLEDDSDEAAIKRENEQTAALAPEAAQEQDFAEATSARRRSTPPPPQVVIPPYRFYHSPRVLIPDYTPEELMPSTPPPENAIQAICTPKTRTPAKATPVKKSPAKATPASKRAHTGTVSKFFIDNRVDIFNSTSSSRNAPAGTSVVPAPPTSAEKFGIIQEDTWREPFWLLVAVVLLNKTTGRAAVPVFKQIRLRYSTPEELAGAEYDELLDMIGHLGLQTGRTRNLIELAKTWVSDPPIAGKLYRKRDYPNKGDGKAADVANIVDEDMPVCRGAIEIGHLRGCGAYAYDSWRIFCRDVLRGVAEDYNGKNATEEQFVPEWQRVLPGDKELRACLRWMWLREGYIWDPLTGDKRAATEDEMEKAALGKMEVEDAQEAKFVAKAAGVEVSPQKQPTGDTFGSSQPTSSQEAAMNATNVIKKQMHKEEEEEEDVAFNMMDDEVTAEDVGAQRANSDKRKRRASLASSSSSRRKTPTRQAKAVQSIEPPDELPLKRNNKAQRKAKREDSEKRTCTIA